MPKFRFITRERTGKWYATLSEAQIQADRIGAGFLDPSGKFTFYRGTVLEMR